MKQGSKKLIQDIIEKLPHLMKKKVEKQFAEYLESKREKLTPEVVERLYLQVIREAKERGVK